jgi:uncharacterized membrane protein YfcA
MDTISIVGYFCAIIIGLVLGLIGGGGSILTVPVFVYLFQINPVLATAYSLFLVGITSLVGTLRNLSQKTVDVKTAIIFSIPAFIAVYATRAFLIPALPETLFKINSFEISKNVFIMLVFAIIMLLSSISMIRSKNKKETKEDAAVRNRTLWIVLEGTVVGFITGLVGAGGGFLIIPALVLLAKLPMKRAVATSLLIIAVKSLIGFLGDVQNLTIDWGFLFLFSTLSIGGIFIGQFLSTRIKGENLKQLFGWFVLIMGSFILYKELIA